MLQKRLKAADVIFVDMGADHHVDVVQPPVRQVFRHGDATAGAVRELRGLISAPINEHDEQAVPAGGVRALQHHGLAITYVYESQSHILHRLTPWRA